MSIPPEQFRRLKWRARRGMLENDLMLERFFTQWEARLTEDDHHGLALLLEQTDNELLDLFVGAQPPQGALDRPDVRGVLDKIRAN